jgi:PKD repeat protein
MSYTVASISQLDAVFMFPNDTVYMPNPVNAWNYSLNSSSWFWDFGDLLGTATDANPFYFYAASGTYTVMMVAYDSLCSDTAWNNIVVIDNVGMPEYLSDDAISLANTPQGADLLFHDFANAVVEVQIFTVDGRLVSASQEAINDGTIHLNMLGYANGNYIVRVINDGKIWADKYFWKQ